MKKVIVLIGLDGRECGRLPWREDAGAWLGHDGHRFGFGTASTSGEHFYYQVRTDVANDWIQFTKRTNNPKLGWLQEQLAEAGIEHRINGESWHAPILEIRRKDHDAAWAILTPVDDIPDDHRMFCRLDP